MAVLKKGSKGKPVEELQKLVNAQRVKPELKVDGIFGPKTDKGVRDAQKKLKLKVDGIAGDYTMAALRYGKPLPERKFEDLGPRIKHVAEARKYNAEKTKLIAQISRDIDGYHKEIVAGTQRLTAIWKEYDALTEEELKTLLSAEKAQKEFDKVLLKNPKAAEKAVGEVEALHEKSSRSRGWRDDTSGKGLLEAKALQSHIAGLSKLLADYVKQLKAK